MLPHPGVWNFWRVLQSKSWISDFKCFNRFAMLPPFGSERENFLLTGGWTGMFTVQFRPRLVIVLHHGIMTCSCKIWSAKFPFWIWSWFGSPGEIEILLPFATPFSCALPADGALQHREASLGGCAPKYSECLHQRQRRVQIPWKWNFDPRGVCGSRRSVPWMKALTV